MKPDVQDLTLTESEIPRNIIFDVGMVSPGNLTLIEALDLAEASGVAPEDFGTVIRSASTREQAMLLYAMAWVFARRVEPGITFDDVLRCNLIIKGKSVTNEKVEAEQKRAATVVAVASLAGVSPEEAERMTVAQVAASTALSSKRATRRARKGRR